MYPVSNQWARYLLNYLYAVSDEDYDDDDAVGRGAAANKEPNLDRLAFRAES